MNVLHLRSSGDLLGAENVVLEIAENSEKFGCRSIVGAVKDAGDSLPLFLEVAQNRGLQTAVFENRKIFDFDCAATIREYIIENQVDVLHCHGYKEDFFGVLSRSSIPKIATNHLWKKTTPKLRGYRLIDIFLLRFFDKVVGVSDGLVSEMQRLWIKNVSKIANGIDVDRYVVSGKSSRLLEQFAIHSNTVVLGMISSLTPEKNHRLVIECLEKINNPNLLLLIVGSGVQEKSLRGMVDQNGLGGQVIFTGRQENIPEILSVVDIYLLPSLAEGLPMSLLEAMSCGKAVIVSRIGEIENVITHQVNGLLVDPGDASALILAIDQLVNDFGLIGYYGERARETVALGYSALVMAEKYCKLYGEVV